MLIGQDQCRDHAGRLAVGQSAVRPHQQSVEPRAHSRRLQRRRRGSGCGRHDAVRGRHRHAGFDPPACRLLRRLRPEADRAPRLAGRRLSRSWRCCAQRAADVLPRPAGAQRRRSGVDLQDHRRAGRSATPTSRRCRSRTCRSSTSRHCASPLRRPFPAFRWPATSVPPSKALAKQLQVGRRDRRGGKTAEARSARRSGARRRADRHDAGGRATRATGAADAGLALVRGARPPRPLDPRLGQVLRNLRCLAVPGRHDHGLSALRAGHADQGRWQGAELLDAAGLWRGVQL